MNLQRHLPIDSLRPFVKTFLIIESDTEQINRVVPDTSVVMAFRYKGNVTNMQDGHQASLPFSVISGLRKSPRVIGYNADSATFLVLFQEGGAAAFFQQPLHELFGQSLPLDDLIHRRTLAETEERLAEAKDNRQRIGIIEEFLLARLLKPFSERLVTHAVNAIKTAHGNISIKLLADSLSISQDAFEKRFRRMVGTSPKQFAAIVRFRHLISARSGASRLTDLAYEAGYFDQAHFIKDFRSFTGQAPHDFFKSSPYW